MMINHTTLNIKPAIIENNFLNLPPEDINFSWWLLNSFKSIFNSPILFSLVPKEGLNIEIQPLAQQIEEKGSLLEKALKENLPPGKTNLLSEFNREESFSEKFLSLISALDFPYSFSLNDLLTKSEIEGDLLLGREARAEENPEIPELMEKKIINSFSPQNNQEKISVEQVIEKQLSLSGGEKMPINFFKEEKFLNLAKANNLNFSLLKDIWKQGEIINAQNKPAPLNSIIAEKISPEQIIEIQKEMGKNQLGNLGFALRERLEQSGQDYLGLNMAGINGWPSLVKEEGKKLTFPWVKENSWEQFSLLGKENNESLASKVEQALNNFGATEKNFFFSFLKGEKKGEIKLADFCSFSPGTNNKDTILSRGSFLATSEVGSKENMSPWRSAEAEIYKQISQKIIWSIKNDQEQIKVTLEPPHLGNIYLEVTREKENIRAKILAENPLTKELIEHNYWPIQKILEKEGFRLERFDVLSQFDMGFGGEAKEENLTRNSPGKIYPCAEEINEPLSLESSLPREGNEGGINILI